MNLLHVSYSGSQWRLTRPLHHGSRVCDGSAGSLRNWYKPFTSEDSVSFSYVFLCHSAAMLKVRRWFKLGAVPDPVSLWVMGACLLLFTLYGRYWQDSFSHIQNPSRASSFLFSFFLVSPCLSASVYFISTCTDARPSEDTGDEAVTCCLHLALHHQQLRLQIYFPVDCGHKSSW